jgi:hypothetical protein
MFSHIPFKVFAQEEFYQLPVLIEPVGDDHILGFNVDPKKRTVSYILPTKVWEFRSPRSAGSQRLNHSGLRSRICLIKRQTFPKSAIAASIQALKAQYRAFGFRDDLSHL